MNDIVDSSAEHSNGIIHFLSTEWAIGTYFRFKFIANGTQKDLEVVSQEGPRGGSAAGSQGQLSPVAVTVSEPWASRPQLADPLH